MNVPSNRPKLTPFAQILLIMTLAVGSISKPSIFALPSWFYQAAPAGMNEANLSGSERSVGHLEATVNKTNVSASANVASTAAAALPPHPRLYITANDIPTLRERYDDPILALPHFRLNDSIADYSDGTSSSGRATAEIRRAIEARAFLYLINNDQEAGEKAVDMLMDFLGSVTQSYNGSTSRARELYDAVIGAAIVYDWCYELLSSSQKNQLISEMQRLASLSEYDWPFNDEIGFLTGHFNEHAPVAMLAAGIAVYDEDPSIFNTMLSYYTDHLAPSRNAFYPMGKHHQGTSYAVTRFFHEAHSALLFDTIGYGNIYDAAQASVPYHMFYARTPSGRFLTEGDISDPSHIDARIQLIMAQLSRDPYLMDDAIRVSDEADYWTLRDSARTFVFWDIDAPQRDIEELTTAQYFPSPSGSMVARTGWDLAGGQGSNVAMAMMNIDEYYFGNHDHLDAGHFGLYYKGTLALDSGTYSGNNGQYNSNHFRNYYQRSIAHNTLLIEDPNEPLAIHYGDEVDSRDGGQYRPGGGDQWFSIEEMFAEGKQAEVLAHAIDAGSRPDYAYLKGDLARGYNAPLSYNYPAKVNEMKRSFVFLDLKNDQHPAALIVFDRVTATDEDFTKKWLLHSETKPEIDGSRVTVTRTDNGNNGRMVNDTLLPYANNHSIDRIGGDGYEFWIDDANYPNEPDFPGYEAGAWRIELSPNQPATTDTFLNVMHVMDAQGGPEPLSPSLLESDQLYGVAIADRNVFFSKDGSLLSESVTLNVSADAALVKVVATDLEPGQWYIDRNGSSESFTVSETAHLYSFEAAPGQYTLTRDPIQPTPTNTAQPTVPPTATNTTGDPTNTPQPGTTPVPPTPTVITPEPTQTASGPTVTPWPTVDAPTATPWPTAEPDSLAKPLAETFEGISGLLDGVNFWRADRAYVETIAHHDVEQALSIAGENAAAYRSLGSIIGTDQVGTLHFRLKRLGSADIFIGLSESETPASFSDFEVQFGAQFGDHTQSSPDKFTVRNGDVAMITNSDFLSNDWYCIWLTVDNQADEFQVYVKHDTAEEASLLTAGARSVFAFRSSPVEALQSFYIRTGYESGKVFVDDIYVTAGSMGVESTTPSCQPTPTEAEPSPEPGTTLIPAATPTPVTTTEPSEPVAPGNRTVSGQVFVDANRNGTKELAEQALSGVVIILSDKETNGRLLTTTVLSDGNGTYSITNLAETEYVLRYFVPPGYARVSPSNLLVDTRTGDVTMPSIGLAVTGSTGDVELSPTLFLPLIAE